jgi:isopentenyl diphosphate isomerase/L-lactate dehydrogenase-like FMN-dependent dehydrogenase
VLPRVLFDYIDGGADDEVTLRENRRAFEDLTFRPRQATYVRPNLATTVLGEGIGFPVLLAPCGQARLAHPDGEIGAARAAVAAGTVSVVSAAAGTTLEDVAGGAGGPCWFQLYFMRGRDGAEVLVQRAQDAGYTVLVVTVDTAVVGNRERDIRNGVVLPMRANTRNALRFAPQLLSHPRWFARFARDGLPFEIPNARHLGPGGSATPPAGIDTALITAPPTWTDIAWLREQWRGPLVVKGVLTGDDARRAVDVGAQAVVVSNHGGRQLDGAPATIRVLPETARAVGADAEVLLDGGIQRGTDVAKALALGARAVLVGRAYLYGLAVGGEAGVRQVLKVLRAELERTLRLIGCASVADLDASWVDDRGS